MQVRPNRWRGVVFAGASLSLSAFALADVKVSKVFSDHMVLQRDAKVPVWGTADAGEAVKVAMNGQEKSTTADDKGKWRVDLDAMPVSDKPAELVVTGKNTVTLSDVLLGEVWICSGQSNMGFVLNSAINSKTEIQAADFPLIRLFTVKQAVSDTPLDDVTGAWQACSPKTAGGFSAVGYFFGRNVHEKLKVPVGLINTSWGGTPAEAWTPMPVLEKDEILKPMVDRYKQSVDNYPQAMAAYEKALAAWKETAATQSAATLPTAQGALKKPGEPKPHNQNAPAHLYNAMINPIVPYAVRGAIWYQGESNAGRAEQYRTLLPAMINSWRDAWNQSPKDYPFYIVQLANFMAETDDPNTPSNWAELREAQSMTATHTPNSGVAVIIDIGETKDIHPKNKQDVGKRLAALALHKTYAQADVVPSGPTWTKMEVSGNVATLRFDDVGGGLVAKNAADGKTVTGLAVAGEDKKFVWADGKISDDGQTITVSSPTVTTPVAVRYAWANNPAKANLYNKADFPASPFRTDDWPISTAGKR